jgi:DNA-binding response OmpR family regulator
VQGGIYQVSEHCILIIEDQEDLAALYETTLKAAGYRTRITLTGEEGLAEFRASGADCILLDMTLPEIQGAQVLHEIRALNASVPVIVISGETHEDLRKQCERLGAQDYLAKPVNYDAMLAAIERALEETPEEAELITLRLPARVIQKLHDIDSNLERAITHLADQQ